MRRLLKAALILLCWLGCAGQALADPPQSRSAAKRLINRVCDLIETEAGKNGLPQDFFARLIWKESRFDPNAVSPVGAEGIAQFMPGTAKLRGLADPFDIEQAIPASAKYLAEMKVGYGNLGLAAAAYNAGENRVSRWLDSGGFLPMETESYVFDIMGEPVDKFSDTAYGGTIQPLDPKTSFAVACRRLPVIMSETVAMASINVKPWGVQVAGNFRRSAAIGQWLRVRGRFPALLASHDPVVSRVRTPIGRRGIYAVRIGADSRAEADGICGKLHIVGGACVVMRNR
ncbi:lytic transglycosylase domain-containing protein [Mesorhizobium sp. WSM4906]|uniref:lytic transglycosylase domain-containing protein n=1 Tax=Mesorhizobium sp. WSM4906 TaxID=3038546 RepID=UPI002415F0E0|nr:lytic transglycosylase domain-containing protein [Mesorhizobium sp. WSM4906]WFP77780.1 lytic transglycosylase domain-containing protein [Mesorhizobium sp. WSM4906]